MRVNIQLYIQIQAPNHPKTNFQYLGDADPAGARGVGVEVPRRPPEDEVSLSVPLFVWCGRVEWIGLWWCGMGKGRCGHD